MQLASFGSLVPGNFFCKVFSRRFCRGICQAPKLLATSATSAAAVPAVKKHLVAGLATTNHLSSLAPWNVCANSVDQAQAQLPLLRRACLLRDNCSSQQRLLGQPSHTIPSAGLHSEIQPNWDDAVQQSSTTVPLTFCITSGAREIRSNTHFEARRPTPTIKATSAHPYQPQDPL